MSGSAPRYWLLKAEPDSRVVKGKDVKFSVDDFEQVKTSPWEGVRNYQARNLMKEMKVGDKALFYHSNCKTPGVAAMATVSKEAYPDYTAWDESHPYYDPKSKADDPRWFMVDLTFASRLTHFVPLALLRYIGDLPQLPNRQANANEANSDSAENVYEIPSELSYLTQPSIQSIKSMDLLTRGRLSVQSVSEGAWDAIRMLGERGGWDEVDFGKKKKGPKGAKKGKASHNVEGEEVEEGEEPAKAKKSEKGKVTKARADSKPKPKTKTKTKPVKKGKGRKKATSEEDESDATEEAQSDEEVHAASDEAKASSSTARGAKRKRAVDDAAQDGPKTEVVLDGGLLGRSDDILVVSRL